MNLNDFGSDIIAWNEQYNIGVEVVDNAHRQLFAIVRKIIELLGKDAYKNQFACKEGLKFFKSYTVRHFAEEEEVMLSINYDGYERHKALHDHLMLQTLPSLERDLEESNYSFASIQRFLGVCIGWLTTHIMIEDKAITGKSVRTESQAIAAETAPIEAQATTAETAPIESQATASETAPTESQTIAKDVAQPQQSCTPSKESTSACGELMKQLFQSVFSIAASVSSERYNGWDVGKAIYYELIYAAPTGKQHKAVWMLEDNLVFCTIGQMLGMKFSEADEIVLSAIKEIAQMFMLQIADVVGIEENHALISNRLMEREEFEMVFHISSPRYSLLFETSAGHFSFCIV